MVIVPLSILFPTLCSSYAAAQLKVSLHQAKAHNLRQNRTIPLRVFDASK